MLQILRKQNLQILRQTFEKARRGPQWKLIFSTARCSSSRNSLRGITHSIHPSPGPHFKRVRCYLQLWWYFCDISTSSIVDFKVDKKTPQPLNVECWHKIGEIFSRECTKNGLTWTMWLNWEREGELFLGRFFNLRIEMQAFPCFDSSFFLEAEWLCLNLMNDTSNHKRQK